MNKETLERIAIRYYEKGDFRTAKILLRQFLTLHGNNEHILLLLAFCEIDDNKYEEATDCAMKISLYFNNLKVKHLILGSIFWKKRDLQGAISEFKIAISLGIPKEIVAEVTNNELRF